MFICFGVVLVFPTRESTHVLVFQGFNDDGPGSRGEQEGAVVDALQSLLRRVLALKFHHAFAERTPLLVASHHRSLHFAKLTWWNEGKGGKRGEGGRKERR